MTHRVNIRTLLAKLARRKGAYFATLETCTVPSMKARGNPFYGHLQKRARTQVILNWNYARSVNNQRKRESRPPTFEALPRSWGTLLSKLPFIGHVTKGGEAKLYLWAKVQEVLSCEYIDTDTGLPVSEDEVRPYLTYSGSTRQGVDNPAVPRNYDIFNIKSLTMDGDQYILERDEAERADLLR